MNVGDPPPVLSASNLCVEILNPNVMRLTGETFEIRSDHEGGVLIHGISALIEKGEVSFLVPFNNKDTA